MAYHSRTEALALGVRDVAFAISAGIFKGTRSLVTCSRSALAASAAVARQGADSALREILS